MTQLNLNNLKLSTCVRGIVNSEKAFLLKKNILILLIIIKTTKLVLKKHLALLLNIRIKKINIIKLNKNKKTKKAYIFF